MAVSCVSALRCSRDPDAADESVKSVKDMTFLQHQPNDDLYVRAIKSLYFPFLLRFHRHGLVLWLAVFVVSIVYGPQFLGLTRSDLDVPAGTSSAKATNALKQTYPEITMLVYIHMKHGLLFQSAFSTFDSEHLYFT